MCAVSLTETGTIFERIWKSLLDDRGSRLFLLQSAMTTTSFVAVYFQVQLLFHLVPACFPQTAHLLTLHCTTNSISRMSCGLWISSWPTWTAESGQVPENLHQTPNVRPANRLYFAPKRTRKVYSGLSSLGFCQSLKTKANAALNHRTQEEVVPPCGVTWDITPWRIYHWIQKLGPLFNKITNEKHLKHKK